MTVLFPNALSLVKVSRSVKKNIYKSGQKKYWQISSQPWLYIKFLIWLIDIFSTVNAILHRRHYHSKKCSKMSLWGLISVDVRIAWRCIWTVLNLGTTQKWEQAIAMNKKHFVFTFSKKKPRSSGDGKRNILWGWP